MNKILREEMEYLIHCDDKAITPDVKYDVSLTLQYIDELENKIDRAIEYLKDNACYENTISELFCDDLDTDSCMELLNILRGEDNESIN